MKRIVLFVLSMTSAVYAVQANEACMLCQINLEPKWENVGTVSKSHNFSSKWVLVGSITFRKRIREKCCLDRITLQWHGNSIENLQATLYKKDPDKQFLPIEENTLSDSSWSKTDQMLIFDFNDRKQTLGPLNIFYIVLTIPEPLEEKLKDGKFSLI